jgi:GNAT superfamily N-acetyltransferase
MSREIKFQKSIDVLSGNTKRMVLIVSHSIKRNKDSTLIQASIEKAFELNQNTFRDISIEKEYTKLEIKKCNGKLEAIFDRYIMIAHALRGLGVGTYILTSLTNIAISLHDKEIEVRDIQVRRDNDDSEFLRKFYERMGFDINEYNGEIIARANTLTQLRREYNKNKVRETDCSHNMADAYKLSYDLMQQNSSLSRENKRLQDRDKNTLDQGLVEKIAEHIKAKINLLLGRY